MWLWVGLYLIVAVVTAQNDVNFTPGNKLQNNIKCEDVLLKLWTIFADQLENNGFNVKVPSRNDILYALTLIKKSILEGGGDVALKEKVFLREAELAKYKGVYLVDHRPLQTLIDQKTTTYEKANFGGPPSQYNLNSPVYSNQLIGFNFGKDFTRNRDEKVPSTINQVPGVNSIDSSKLHHAVKLSKETNHLLGSDYTSDLEHAKGVADKMNKLYQSSNEYKYNLNSQRPLRNSNYVAASVEVMDNPWDTSSNSKPAVVQTSYVSQSHIHTNSNNNQNQDSSQPNVYMYNLPAQETNNNALNPSLTLITNNAQSNANAFKNTILKPEYTNQFNTFVNAKYHPNPDHFGEATKEVLPSKPSVTNNAYAQATSNQKIIFNMHKNPFNQNKEVGQTLQYTPQNDQMSNLNAIKTNINQPPFILNNRLNNNPNYLTNPNTWNQPQTKALPPYIYNLLYPNKFNPTASALRPNNAIYNQFYPQGVNTQNSINNMPFGQRIINGFPRPQTDQGVAVNRPSLPYTGYFNNNGPFTQKLNYYNDEMVIDKLANWISGTNPVKLNSNIDTEEAEIELTYRVNKPPPLYQPAVFYVKFRMPYNQFAQHLADFLRIKENSRSLSTNSDLYNDLAAQYNATVIQTDMADAPEDIKSPEGKFLVRARYIQPNESGNANPNSVDIINLDKEAEPNKENVQGRARNVESNNDRMQLEDV